MQIQQGQHAKILYNIYCPHSFPDFCPIITPSPFIMFPSAIANSIAVLLLPSVAKAQADGETGSICESLSISMRYSLYMGILCIGVFLLFGESLGITVFHDSSVGYYIQVLSWLCPFLYLATTMGSILNGLGKTKVTFLHNVSGLLMRIAFVLIVIPRYGIIAYLWGMLASEIFLAMLHLRSLKKLLTIPWDAWDMIVKPVLLLAISIGIYYFIEGFFSLPAILPPFIQTALWILLLCTTYGGLMLMFHFGKQSKRCQ